MLYDNALLVGVLSEAYQLTKKESYAKAIRETLEFIRREMTSEEQGFYSALDADSEGVEGKFYTWSLEEIETLLGADAALFCEYYDISAAGNWEHTNILRIKEPPEIFAARKNMTGAALEARLGAARQLLLEHRSKRIRPLLDDKILLGWNAMMCTAYTKAYAALGDLSYHDTAIANIEFLEQHMQDTNDRWFHTYKEGKAKVPAFLDDLACLVQAYIHLQEITGDGDYLHKARAVTEAVIRDFGQDETAFFYFTNAGQQDLIMRKKEVYDGATPSGNALMAANLFYLSIVFDIPGWKERAEAMLGSLAKAILRYPGSFSVWSSTLQIMTHGMLEIAILGQRATTFLRPVLERFIPNKILQAGETNRPGFPLLDGKNTGENGSTAFYLCKDYHCKAPFFTMEKLLANV
jgi:uncharacterized protein YyaL (SSP411 family)